MTDDFPDVMVDLETTGTQPDRTAILQLAAVRFNLEAGTVDTHFFNRCLALPPHRHWDEPTRAWWLRQNPAVLAGILGRQEDPRQVLRDFVDWAEPARRPVFWAKPLSFDFPFVASYCRDFELPMPFDFRRAMDVTSFLRARYFPRPVPDPGIPFEGDAHHALFDVLHQIQVLFHHLQATS